MIKIMPTYRSLPNSASACSISYPLLPPWRCGSQRIPAHVLGAYHVLYEGVGRDWVASRAQIPLHFSRQRCSATRLPAESNWDSRESVLSVYCVRARTCSEVCSIIKDQTPHATGPATGPVVTIGTMSGETLVTPA